MTKGFSLEEFEEIIEKLKPPPSEILISIIVSDKWGNGEGLLKAQLDSGFHYIITKTMLEKMKDIFGVQPTSPNTILSYLGIPIYESDDMAEKVLVEAYFRKNPFPVWIDKNPYIDLKGS